MVHNDSQQAYDLMLWHSNLLCDNFVILLPKYGNHAQTFVTNLSIQNSKCTQANRTKFNGNSIDKKSIQIIYITHLYTARLSASNCAWSIIFAFGDAAMLFSCILCGCCYLFVSNSLFNPFASCIPLQSYVPFQLLEYFWLAQKGSFNPFFCCCWISLNNITEMAILPYFYRFKWIGEYVWKHHFNIQSRCIWIDRALFYGWNKTEKIIIMTKY